MLPPILRNGQHTSDQSGQCTRQSSRNPLRSEITSNSQICVARLSGASVSVGPDKHLTVISATSGPMCWDLRSGGTPQTTTRVEWQTCPLMRLHMTRDPPKLGETLPRGQIVNGCKLLCLNWRNAAGEHVAGVLAQKGRSNQALWKSHTRAIRSTKNLCFSVVTRSSAWTNVANWDAQHLNPLLRWWSLTSPNSGLYFLHLLETSAIPHLGFSHVDLHAGILIQCLLQVLEDGTHAMTGTQRTSHQGQGRDVGGKQKILQTSMLPQSVQHGHDGIALLTSFTRWITWVSSLSSVLRWLRTNWSTKRSAVSLPRT